MAQIITALSVVIAVATYFFQRKQARLESIAKQIHLFRTEVISFGLDSVNLVSDIKAKSGKELVPVELIDEFSIKWFLRSRTLETLKQQAFWGEAQKIHGDNYGLPIHNLLNTLEELAIAILAENTSSNSQLKSIRKAFVSYVEVYAWHMILSAPYSPDMYPAIRKLYGKWRDQIDRMPIDELKKKVRDDIQAAANTIRGTMSKDEYDKLMK